MDLVRGLGAVGRDDVETVGGKAAGLGELLRAGLPVPPGFVVTTPAYASFLAENDLGDLVAAAGSPGPDAPAEQVERDAARIRAALAAGAVPAPVREAVLAAYAGLGGGPVAVRSSATTEDLAGASAAGQQDTYLNVRGADAVVDAVRACWASLWTGRALAYRARRGVGAGEVALAVVVQVMVDADASGVMFTADPTTGRRDLTVVSAAWGLGESVVGGTVGTQDLVLDGATGAVLSRTDGDQAVRTVPVEGGTAEEPLPPALRSARVLADADAAVLAALGRRAAEHLGAPQDLEWARAGGTLWLVQSRPVTALPPPEAPPPTSWVVPRPSAFYVRASIVEQLPDPLTPLFAELVDASVTRSLVALTTELIGPGTVRPGDVSLPTVNGYAYYCYSRAGMWRVTRGSLRALPVLAAGGRRSGVTAWREVARPAYAAAVARWPGRDPAGLDAEALLAGVVELLDAGTTYYTAVQQVIPVAATAETVFTRFYERLVRRPGDPPALTFLLGFPSAPVAADEALHDLARWVAGQPGLAEALAASGSAEGTDPPVVAAWTERWRGHLDRFGHTVYNLDFATPVAADSPGALLDTLLYYARGEGVDPHARRTAAASAREAATAQVLARLGPARRAAFTRLLRRAQATAPVREDALADVGLAWPRLRSLLRELGDRLVAAGAVEEADDVCWLRSAEIRAALAAGPAASQADVVAERRAVWRGRRRVVPPQVLPVGSGWDRLFRRFLPATAQDQPGDVLTGLAGSAGRVTGRARVLRGPADFARLQPGEVLVAAVTTPAWTPLFARAAAVVTDIGGPLSHSSIVAREYGVPAVLGTGVATRRIADGDEVTVDGDAGTVRLRP